MRSGRNFYRHPFRREGEGVHHYWLLRVYQRPVISCYNIMNKHKNIQLCQLVPRTQPGPTTKRYKRICLNRIHKSTRVEPHRVREILFIIMGPICRPKHLLHNNISLQIRVMNLHISPIYFLFVCTFHPLGIVNPSNSISVVAFLKDPKMGGNNRMVSRATCHVYSIFFTSSMLKISPGFFVLVISSCSRN